MACTPLQPLGGLKILEKSLLGGLRKFYFGGGGSNFVGGSCNFEGKIKTCIIPVEGVFLE